MHNTPNTSNFSRPSLTFCGHVWALVLGLSLVCFSRAGYSDVVTNSIPTGPFEGDYVLTNITFSTPEQLIEYRDTTLNLCDDIYSTARQIRNAISWCSNSCSLVVNHCDIIDQYADSASSTTSDAIKRETRTIRQYVSTGYTGLNNIPRQMSQIDANLSNLISVTDYVTNAVDSYTLYNATYASAAFAESSSGESGCCSCPDYTSILQAVSSSLDSILTTVGQLEYDLSSCSTSLDHLDDNVYTIVTYLIEISSTLDSISAAFVPIATDTTNISYFLTNTFWQYLQQLYLQIDTIRADVELGFIQVDSAFSNVLSRLFSERVITFYDRWLYDWRTVVSSGNPFTLLPEFTSESPIFYQWAKYNNFREYIQWGVLDYLAYLNGEIDSSYVDADALRFFITPLVSVVTNLYDTARPELVQSRSLVYKNWAQGVENEDLPGMPSTLQVASQPMADAVIGLLYRIQYLLSAGYKPVESNQISSVLQDIPPDANRYAQAVNTLEFIVPNTTNVPFLRVYSEMKSSLERLKPLFGDHGVIADHWLVLYEDGFSVEFTGSGGEPLVSGVSAPIYLTAPDFDGSQSHFVYLVSNFMGCIWYGISGIVCLAVTYFAFRFFWIATTFTIAVIGGDFSSAISQFGEIGKTLTGGGD